MIIGHMALRGLVPYAIAGLLVVAGSTVAVLSTIRPANVGAIEAATATPVVTPARGAPELSRVARLAYWRESKLWVSDLDGSLRHAIAATEDLRRISLTRWAIDGSAIAFVDSGLSLAVVTPDGARTDIDVPIELRNLGYRISDLRWSPNGQRIVALFLRPGDGRHDAFIADLTRPKPSWSRLTTLEDLFIGDWISNDELLAYTGGGVIGVLGANATNAMRLIAGVQGITPVIGPEGRIHFLVGRLPTSVDPSLPYITLNRASVWSAATDGGDVRRESAWELNDIRLDGRLPDGRYLVHRGSNNAQATVSDDVDLLPTNAGTIERIRLAPDGRTAYGSTSQRVVRVDLAKLVAGPAATPSAGVSVFIDGSESDVWFPTALSLARGGARVTGAPATRSVFALGSHIWQLENGTASLLRPAPIARRTGTPLPRWSPTGDHVLVVEQAGPTAATTTFVAFAVDRGGRAVRLSGTEGASRSFAWSPTGGEVAIAVDRRGLSGLASDAQLEIRFFDPSGRQTRTPVSGSEVAWTAKGLLVLRDLGGAPTLQAIEGEGQARTILTRERLLADPRASTIPAVGGAVNGLDAAADGAYGIVRLQVQDISATRAFIVVFNAGGTPVQYLRSENVSDLAMSPGGPLIGYTLDVRTSTERAVVASPEGNVVATRDGRFAGWSPDGKWYFVSRVAGLYAYPLAAGAPVRLGPGGAPLSATASR